MKQKGIRADLVNTRAKKIRKDQKVMDFISNKSTEGAAWQKEKRKTIITYLSFFSQIQRSWINDAETTIEAEGRFCGCELSWQSTVEKVYLVYILSGLLCYCGLSWKLCISFISFKGGRYSARHTERLHVLLTKLYHSVLAKAVNLICKCWHCRMHSI